MTAGDLARIRAAPHALTAVPAGAGSAVRVYAAGSLRAVMSELSQSVVLSPDGQRILASHGFAARP